MNFICSDFLFNWQTEKKLFWTMRFFIFQMLRSDWEKFEKTYHELVNFHFSTILSNNLNKNSTWQLCCVEMSVVFWLNGEKKIFSEKYLPAQYKLEKKSTSIASCFPKYLGNPYDYEETTNFIQVLILSILLLFGVINVFAFSVFEIFEFSLFKFFSNFISRVFYYHYTDKIIITT